MLIRGGMQLLIGGGGGGGGGGGRRGGGRGGGGRGGGRQEDRGSASREIGTSLLMGIAAGGRAMVTEGVVSSKVPPVIKRGGSKDAETLAPGGWIIVLVDAQASPAGGRGGAFRLAELRDESPKFATFERRKYAAFNSSSCLLKPGSSSSRAL